MSIWYGATAAWWARLERDARRVFGPDLMHHYELDQLTYHVRDLDVPGEAHPIDVNIRFYAEPRYDTYGQPPEDFPRVHAKPSAASPHRYTDGALCLWHPHDPIHNRWTSDKGLLELIEITRRHLFLEHYWRFTGSHRRGIWLLPDAPHGLDKPA